MWKTVGLQAHGLQRPHAADAQHDFLADARIVVAAVERIGDVAILRQDVFGDVGVEQVQRDPAHVQFPNLDANVAGGQLHGDLQVLARCVLHRRNRQGIEVVDRVALLLPAVGVELLPEIALLVEQAEADQRIILVAARISDDRPRECPGRPNRPAGTR